jgi:hypothetical protein
METGATSVLRAVISDFAQNAGRYESSVRNLSRIVTSNVPLHSGRKPEGPYSLPLRERIADTVRTELCMFLTGFFFNSMDFIICP